MKIKAGDTVVFYGCVFDDGWEFDAPTILYHPIKRYSANYSNSSGVESLVENACIDHLCNGDDVSTKWCDSDLSEFNWRGWNPGGFKRRKKAQHVKITVSFKISDDPEWRAKGILDIDRWEVEELKGPPDFGRRLGV